MFFKFLYAALVSIFIVVISKPAAAGDYDTIPNVTEGINTSLCPEFFPQDYVDLRDRDLLTICRINYAIIYDRDCRVPLLTFERLDRTELDGLEPRARFKVDPDLHPEDRAELEDFVGSGWDRGHLVPAADMREDSASMQQTFYLSNIAPQYPRFNRTTWRLLEAEFRENIVNTDGESYIITGTIVDYEFERLNGRVCIPTQFYKNVYYPTGEAVAVIGFNFQPTGDTSLVQWTSPSALLRFAGFGVR